MNYNRKLTPLETAMELLNHSSASFNVLTMSKIKGDLNPETLQKSLELVQQRHPRLNSRIIGNLNNLYFTNDQSQKILLKTIKFQDQDQLQQIIKSELNQKIDREKILFRTLFIRGDNHHHEHYFITLIHHAIIDGLSSLKLHSEIFTYCDRITQGEKINIQTLPVLPPIHDLFPPQLQGIKGTIKHNLYFLKTIFKEALKKISTLEIEKNVPVDLRSCGVVQKQLNAEITSKLVLLCREKQTTVNAVLAAIMLLTVIEKISNKSQDKIPVSVNSYIDLRRRLQPQINDENLGVLVSYITSIHKINHHTCIWELSRDIKEKINELIASTEIFSSLMFSDKIIENLLKNPQIIPTTIAITNAGQINIPAKYGNLELQEISYIPAQAILMGVFGVAVTTFSGQMVLNFMFSEPSLSEKTIKNLTNKVISSIIKLCDISVED